MKIKIIALTDFRGNKSFSAYDVDNNVVIIKGRNGIGKTTIATAFYWLFCDKDYELNSNPSVFPNDGRECEPSVEVQIEHDGHTYNLTKTQKRTGKSGNISNKYEIDDVDKTKKEFDAFLSEIGIDTDKFLYLSNPLSFTGQTKAAARDILFSLATEKTDNQIAKGIKDIAEIKAMLKEHSIKDIESLMKKKTAEIDKLHGKKGEITRARIQERESVANEIFEYCLKNDLDTAAVGKANDDALKALKEKQTEYEQAKADCERILYQAQLITEKKEDKLTDEINSHFDLVKFKLCDVQKNGERVAACIPSIQDEHGIWKEWQDMNGGLRVKAQIDICQSLQKFYGVELPIFVDEAAEVNDWNIPQTDSQLILLKVTEDKELKIENV